MDAPPASDGTPSPPTRRVQFNTSANVTHTFEVRHDLSFAFACPAANDISHAVFLREMLTGFGLTNCSWSRMSGRENAEGKSPRPTN